MFAVEKVSREVGVMHYNSASLRRGLFRIRSNLPGFAVVEIEAKSLVDTLVSWSTIVRESTS